MMLKTRINSSRLVVLLLLLALLTVHGGAQGQETFQNPVMRNDFPDPFILLVDGTYYAYATNSAGKNVQVSRSSDLVRWDVPTEALPGLPTWASANSVWVWSPEVIRMGDGFVMYYTAEERASKTQCIGVAESAEPGRRFRDSREEPLICPQSMVFDAHPFQDDDGQLYLLWASCCSPSHIHIQELTADGLDLIGEATRLISNDEAWEGSVVGAPTMWRHEENYYLFYSANDYREAAFGVGYATCTSVTGPCEKAAGNPILSSRREPLVIAPGGQAIIEDGAGQTWLAYHAWEVVPAGVRSGRRLMWLDRLNWQDGQPMVQGPTTEPQPIPGTSDD